MTTAALEVDVADRAFENWRRRSRRRASQLSALVALLIGVVAVALVTGPMAVTLSDVGAVATGRLTGTTEVSPTVRAVVEQIRLPRIVLGALIGAVLGMSGAAMQGLFRNPLADPGIIGVSAGAALAAVAVIVLGDRVLAFLPAAMGPLLLPLAAFLGALVTMTSIYFLSLHEGRVVVATMLLAGVAVAALAMALTGFLVFLATDDQIRDVTFWSLGSLGGATWGKVAWALPCAALTLGLLPAWSRALNALLLGEAEARHVGFDVDRAKWAVILLTALGVGAAVAMSGVIGFVGLVVPHVVRLVAGPDHRFLLPGAALLGATLLVGADVIARTVAAPAELPIGILTAILGAPFFLWLLLRNKGAWQS